jgi:hypothetical protein
MSDSLYKQTLDGIFANKEYFTNSAIKPGVDLPKLFNERLKPNFNTALENFNRATNVESKLGPYFVMLANAHVIRLVVLESIKINIPSVQSPAVQTVQQIQANAQQLTQNVTAANAKTDLQEAKTAFNAIIKELENKKKQLETENAQLMKTKTELEKFFMESITTVGKLENLDATILSTFP